MVQKIIDFISGKEVSATPEEIESTQLFSKILVEDYGYPKDNIQTRPQFTVKVRPSDNVKSYPVDIAVFESAEHTDRNLQIIVECKKKNRKDGRTQLENYLTLSNARIGVWFNGDEKLFLYKITKAGGIEFREIPNIPRFGEKLEDVGQFKRCDLKPTHNLKSTFNTIRNYLAANAIGVTQDAVLAQQLINIIFCKIYDEKFTNPDDIVAFRAGIGEKPSDVKKRIVKIFDKVKQKYKGVIEDTDSIDLDENSVVYVVGELQNFCLMDADRDIVADAFETFIGHALKGDMGQFFTPRNIVRMMVNIMNPSADDYIIDPACGSGGFLVETLKYIWNKIDSQGKSLRWSDLDIQEEKMAVAIERVRGIEKDKFLAKVTKAYMAILGDGKGGIFCEDSLDRPENWVNEDTKVKVKLNNFSMVLTNPPFGAKINVCGEDKLSQYEFGYKWDKNTCEKQPVLKPKENPQILFIERSLQLLKDGGKLGIVLPETYLHGPSVKYIIKHLERKNNIFAVVDLPHNTFRPYCNAKCIILFVQKNTPQQDVITMGIVEQMGHNHQGKPIYRFDETTKQVTKDLWDDSEFVIEEFKHPADKNNKYVFQVRKQDIVNSLYVPRYYYDRNIKYLEYEAREQNCDLITMKTLVDEGIVEVYKGHGAPPSEYKGKGEVFYVRAGDVIDWDIYKNPTSAIPYSVYKQQVLDKKSALRLQAKDILFVKEGSYRVGDVAILSEFDTDIFLNHHTLVFRVTNEDNKYGIDAFYLLYLLSHGITRKQFYNKIMIDTTLPNIGDRWSELKLPVSRSEQEKQKIKCELRDVFERKWSVQSKLYSVKNRLGIHLDTESDE